MNAVMPPQEIDISELMGKRTSIAEQVERAPLVDNDTDEGKANDLMKIIKNFIKKANDDRLAGTKWFRDKTDEINDKYNSEIIDPLKALLKKLEGKTNPYVLKKLNEKEEKEQLAREALEREAIEKASNLEKSGDHAGADEVLETAEKASDRIHQSTTVRSTYGAVTSVGKKFDFEIENTDLVPREYCDPVESKIRKAINGEGRVSEIPGVRIFETVRRQSR